MGAIARTCRHLVMHDTARGVEFEHALDLLHATIAGMSAGPETVIATAMATHPMFAVSELMDVQTWMRSLELKEIEIGADGCWVTATSALRLKELETFSARWTPRGEPLEQLTAERTRHRRARIARTRHIYRDCATAIELYADLAELVDDDIVIKATRILTQRGHQWTLRRTSAIDDVIVEQGATSPAIRSRLMSLFFFSGELPNAVGSSAVAVLDRRTGVFVGVPVT